MSLSYYMHPTDPYMSNFFFFFFFFPEWFVCLNGFIVHNIQMDQIKKAYLFDPLTLTFSIKLKYEP